MLKLADSQTPIETVLIGYENDRPRFMHDFTLMSPKQLELSLVKGVFTNADTRFIYEMNLKMARSYDRFKSFGELTDAYKGQTAAVIGAGPSLSRHLDDLKSNPGVVTIGVNAACKAHPWDIVFMMDRIVRLEWLSEAHSTEQILITTPTAAPTPLTLGWRDVYLYRAGADNDPHWKGYPVLYSNSFTTVTALHAVYLMGFKKVLLYGNDFAYTKDSYYYCGKAGKIIMTDEEITVSTPTGEVITNKTMINHALRLKVARRFLEQAGVKVINKSEGISDVV